jgi:hypothetical protein
MQQQYRKQSKQGFVCFVKQEQKESEQRGSYNKKLLPLSWQEYENLLK